MRRVFEAHLCEALEQSFTGFCQLGGDLHILSANFPSPETGDHKCT
jgi:hypothetical protein